MAANDSGRAGERFPLVGSDNPSRSYPRSPAQHVIECERCRTTNPAEYRFCGSCGHLLRRQSAATTVAPEARSVSGPSFLGLGESVEEDRYSYLLDDEPPRRGFGAAALTILFLLLLGGAAYAAYWKFYYVPDHVAAKTDLPSAPAFAYEHTPPPPLKVDPAEIPLPSRSTADQKSLEALAANAAPKSAATAQPAARKSASAGAADDDEETDDSPSQSSKLLADGEKYLYGRGVPSNCKQAVKSFEAAADMDNSKAMSRLGTLYASGRCVKFDRVQAYQWFARAKNADPNDTWAEASMDMLWRNMNLAERRAVLK
jgi:hypothetical protein